MRVCNSSKIKLSETTAAHSALIAIVPRCQARKRKIALRAVDLLMRLKPGVFVYCSFFALLGPIQAEDKDKPNHTITLVCSTGMSYEASPTTLELNEAEGLVTIHYGSKHNRGGNPDPIPGTTSGPVRAHFTQNMITFVVNDADRHTNYRINRVTGVIGIVAFQEGRQFPFEWTCHVGNAQF